MLSAALVLATGLAIQVSVQMEVEAEGALSGAVVRGGHAAGGRLVSKEPEDLDADDARETSWASSLWWLWPPSWFRGWFNYFWWWMPSGWFHSGPCPENYHDSEGCPLCPITKKCIAGATEEHCGGECVGPLTADDLCYDRSALLRIIDFKDGRNVQSPYNHEVLTKDDIQKAGWNRVNFRCSMRNIACDETGTVRKVDLSFSQLKELPAEIGSLSQLEELHLRNNELTSLPDELGSLTRLEELDLRSNRLTTLPPAIAGLTSLEELDLGSNLLAELPAELGKLTKLEELKLMHNRLESVPPELGRLGDLSTLLLNGNRLATVPKEFGNLWSLQELDLNKNDLVSLPGELGRLHRLGLLALYGNPNLRSLPEEVSQLSTRNGGRTVVISDQ